LSPIKGDCSQARDRLGLSLRCQRIDVKDEDNMSTGPVMIAMKKGFAKPGERLIISAGVPFGTSRATNFVCACAFVWKSDWRKRQSRRSIFPSPVNFRQQRAVYGPPQISLLRLWSDVSAISKFN